VAKLHPRNFLHGNLHLPGEAFDKPGALHVAAKKAQGEPDAFPENRVFVPQQLHGFNKTGNADHGIAAGHVPDRLEHG
jgi:hypothetical protein